jgi:photosystem II stability/assembly factor-like uncharacterized protein
VAGTTQGVFISTNGGTVWSSANSGIDGNAMSRDVQVLLFRGSTLFAGTANGLFASSNNGGSWTHRDSGISPTKPQKSVTCLIAVDSTIIAGTEREGIYLSSDEGQNWTHNSSNDGWQVVGLATCGARLFVANLAGGVLSSTDWGSNWSESDMGLQDTISHYNLFLTSIVSTGTKLLVGTYYYGIFLSTDLGQSWNSVDLGLKTPANIVNSIMVHGQNIFVGTDGGIWRRQTSEILTSTGIIRSGIPGLLKLEQNFPNPCNPTTTIQYELPTQAEVEMNIYDTLGQRVASLVHGVQAAGTHRVRFDGSAFASGVFFYQIRSGRNHMQTKKLILLR